MNATLNIREIANGFVVSTDNCNQLGLIGSTAKLSERYFSDITQLKASAGTLIQDALNEAREMEDAMRSEMAIRQDLASSIGAAERASVQRRTGY